MGIRISNRTCVIGALCTNCPLAAKQLCILKLARLHLGFTPVSHPTIHSHVSGTLFYLRFLPDSPVNHPDTLLSDPQTQLHILMHVDTWSLCSRLRYIIIATPYWGSLLSTYLSLSQAVRSHFIASPFSQEHPTGAATLLTSYRL